MLVSVYSMVTVVLMVAALQMVRNWNLPSLSASCGFEEEDISVSVPSESIRLLSRAFPLWPPLREKHQEDLIYESLAIFHANVVMINYYPNITMKQALFCPLLIYEAIFTIASTSTPPGMWTM